MTTMTTELEKVEREGGRRRGNGDEYRKPTPLRVPANGCLKGSRDGEERRSFNDSHPLIADLRIHARDIFFLI